MRSSAGPATASTATRAAGRDDPRGRPRRDRARHPVAHRRQPDAARYQAPRRERARGHGGARPRRRPHADRSCPRSRATRRPASRCCTCASTIGSPADVARRGARGLPRPLPGDRRPGHRDRAGDARRRARRRSTSSSCSPSRSCGSPIVGGPSAGDAMTDASMPAWTVAAPGADRRGPTPTRHARESRSPVPERCASACAACGVCRTDLHLAEGDLAPRHAGVVPGHEIVGRVDARGAGAERFALGDRIGIAWLRHTCGVCRWCRAARRTCALRRSSPAGTPTADTRRGPSSTSATRTSCPIATTTSTRRRSSARASSATARCDGRSSHPAAGSGSTASARPRISSRRSRSSRVRPCTS